MTLNNPEIQLKVLAWQDELREMTGNVDVILQAYAPLKFVAPEKTVPAEHIIEIVCEETGIEYATVLKKSRKREVVITRQLIAFYCKNCTGMSLQSIGEILGGRDHTTVIHSVKTIQNLLDTRNVAVLLPASRINKKLGANGVTLPTA